MVLMDKVPTNLVFTPSSPAKKSFVEREVINDQLVDALRTPGKQIIIYGHSGSGKTTLLINKLNQVYENHIITRCMKDSTIENILIDAFDNLNKYYVVGKDLKKTKTIGLDIETMFEAIKGVLSFKNVKEKGKNIKRVVPVQLTPSNLAKFFGHKKCCWVLEDFHKVNADVKKSLSQIMKVFMDSAIDYPDVKIIAIGAVATAREVVNWDPEMKNRVTEIYVPLMETKELREIIRIGEGYLNISIGASTKKRFARYSSGLASICHQLCLNMCYSAGINETLEENYLFLEKDFRNAIQTYLRDNSDTLKQRYNNAAKDHKIIKYSNAKEIINAMLRLDKEDMTHNEIWNEIKKIHPKYPAGNLSTYLKQLRSSERGEIIRFDESSNKYSFSDPFFKAYAYCVTGDDGIKLTREEIIRISFEKFKELYKKEFENGNDETHNDKYGY